jgi:SPP1 family predicted phage head-tail adaptor
MARKYKAGDLRHAVTLLEPTVTMNGNRRTVTWTEHQAMAGKRDVSGKQFFTAAAYHTEDIVTYLIRYREDVTAGWRLRHHGIEYDIMTPNHLDYMGDYMELRCRRVSGSGV